MTGQTILQYQIGEKLGEGGMGVVYKAYDTNLKRTVALKFLPSHLAASPGVMERFLREASAISAVNHPHIAIIHDMATVDGQCFLVLEYLPGRNAQGETASGTGRWSQLLRIRDPAVCIADSRRSGACAPPRPGPPRH